jgi:hypothetical protein
MVNLNLLSLKAFAASSACIFETMPLSVDSILSLTEYVVFYWVGHKPFA